MVSNVSPVPASPDASAEPAAADTPAQSSASNAETRAASLGLRAPSILFEGDESPVPQVPETGPKFALPLSPPSPPVDTPLTALSEDYGTRRLFLAARDPHCLYVHWESRPVQGSTEAQPAPPAALLLRIHMGDLTGPTVHELQVSGQAQHSFVQVEAAGNQYVAELGYQTPNSDWKSLIASQPASTPPNQVADTQVVRFATFPLETTLSPDTRPTAGIPKSTPPTLISPPGPAQPEAPTTLSPAKPALVAPVVAAGAYPLSAEPPNPEDPVPFLNRELTTHPPQAVISDEPILEGSDWTAAREQALEEIIGWKSIQSDRPDSAQLAELVPLPAEITEAWASGITSPGAEPTPARPEFWLRVNAELVVYGAAAPDSDVRIGGRRIHLRPDGSFSYRFALPDGQYELPIAAHSAQGEVREAKLWFQRATAFMGDVGAEAQTPGLTAPDPNILI
jgi:uncharacterized protein